MGEYRKISDVPEEEREIVGVLKNKNYTVTLYNQIIPEEQWDRIYKKIAEIMYEQIKLIEKSK